MSYLVKRMFFENHIEARTIERGLTLEQAQEHCRDDDTSSSTASQETLDLEKQLSGSVKWFDGYEKE